jgi:hypothetical protein
MRKWAIADAGATGHFMMMGAPVINTKPTNNPITIKLPHGKDILSTHTCNLNIPWRPPHMTEAHIVPGMAHSSLIFRSRNFATAGAEPYMMRSR